jgi:hypothetical protein
MKVAGYYLNNSLQQFKILLLHCNVHVRLLKCGLIIILN